MEGHSTSKTELAKDENAVRVFIAREAFEHHENTINARRRVAREAAQGVQKGNKSTGSNILGGEIGDGVLARESKGSSPKTPDITINAVMQVTGERDESKKHYFQYDPPKMEGHSTQSVKNKTSLKTK